ncbi:MAG: ribonuclease III [Candidatus Sericytochromatia bacterium]|nr:ribonuclease III [Candidatus Sericytochromatia bacterium]
MTRPVAPLVERAGLPAPHDDPRYAEALTHPSSDRRPHYERLEYLGDAVLKLVVSEWLFARMPAMSEGSMTQIRAHAVSDETLARVAQALDLGPHLILGTSEKRSQGREKTSILASAFEALIGAAHVVHGPQVAADLLKRWLGPEFDRALAGVDQHNPKALLQEFTQRRWQCLPDYQVEASSEAQAHRMSFQVTVSLAGRELGAGTGNSKRQASQAAAAAAIAALQAAGEWTGDTHG